MGIGKIIGFGSKPASNTNLFGFGKKMPSNTNILGIPKSKPSTGNIFGFGGSNKKSPVPLRQSTHFTTGGRYNNELRRKLEKLGTFELQATNQDGTMSREKYKTTKEKIELLKRAVGRSGIDDKTWMWHMEKKKGFTAIDKYGNKKEYTISGTNKNIKLRRALGSIFEPEGPSAGEIALKQRQAERIKRLNVLETQRGREREDEARQLMARRMKGQKASVDFRNKDNTKYNASNIGVKGIVSSVSAQINSEKHSGLGVNAGPQNTLGEGKQGTAADLMTKKENNTAKGIGEAPDIPMFRKAA